jgi:hypothetical protein
VVAHEFSVATDRTRFRRDGNRVLLIAQLLRVTTQRAKVVIRVCDRRNRVCLQVLDVPPIVSAARWETAAAVTPLCRVPARGIAG